MTDAIANGDIPAMNEAMEDMANNFIDASTGTEEALALQTIEFAKNLSEMKQAAEIEGSKITQAQVENSEIMYQKSLEEWSKLSGMSAEELEKTLGTVGSFTPLFRNKSEKLGQECASGLESQQGNVKTSCEALSDGV